MSRLSQLIHRYESTDIVRAVVQYLETVDIPGPQRKEIAMAVLKLLHVQAGGQWDDALASTLSGAIEYVLSEVRQYASRFDRQNTPAPQPAEPPVTSIYDVATTGTLPDDAALLKMGFTTGDTKLVSKDKSQWMVIHTGGVYNPNDWDSAGRIGG